MTDEEKNKIVDTELWDDYQFSNSSNLNNSLSNIGIAGQIIIQNPELTESDYTKQWIHFGADWTKQIKSYWSQDYASLDQDNSLKDNINNLSQNTFSALGSTLNSGMLILNGAINAITLGAAQGLNYVSQKGLITDAIKGIESYIASRAGSTLNFLEQQSNNILSIVDTLSNTGSTFLNIIGKGLDIWSSGALRQYKNGIDETSFGRLMDSSWNKSDNSFSALLKGKGSYLIKIAKSTPFDSGENMSNLYGKMMLGAPPLFNNITDPKNRSISNTFLRDAKFLTLTPGMPKYNGSNYLLKQSDDAYHQTKSPDSMLAYLLRNGLDADFATKDRRYYTFQADYKEYYSYLETMLNTVWIKMGLGQETPNTFNMFSFFDMVDENGNPKQNAELKSQYKTSLGFFVNPSGSLTENISNQTTSFSIGSDANTQSDNYQQINYLTGMGSGGAFRQSTALMAKHSQLFRQITEFSKSVASSTISTWQNEKGLKRALLTPLSILSDISKFTTEQDNGAVMQSFATTNGMKVVYPELWNDSTYTKSVNINFDFTSPYGDPLSIFNYVIAPFLALLCFAMPRQAADNGYVSPFFVRADIPGLFTSDLALIQDFSWSKGGDNNLWTKDGLPRSISGSFLLVDLYPYLAMTKRISFLSANPNYTVFLDNLAGLHAIDVGNTDDALNEYYKALLNRVSGESPMTHLWNNYSLPEKEGHIKYANHKATNRLGGNTKHYNSSSWLRGLK